MAILDGGMLTQYLHTYILPNDDGDDGDDDDDIHLYTAARIYQM